MLRRLFQRIKQIAKWNMASSVEGKTGEKRTGDDTVSDISKKQKVEPNVARADRKRKVALLIAYNGKGYYGLQLNPGFPSIEGDIIKAILEAGLITQDHADTPRKMSFQRAARTDKGVSAAGNLLSLKMLMNKENLLEEINKHLPPQIRVFEVVRTTNGFNSKDHCCGRTYIYILPTYAFAPVEEICTLEYRTNKDIIERVNEVLLKFQGTHNFHNFTSGIKPFENCAKRYIIDFECGKPFVRDGVEFCVLSVRGQSFMLHQIRKMIGLTIAILRGHANIDAIEEAYNHEKMDIPRAPALGLMLEKLHYDHYNRRYASDGSHERIDFNHLREKISTFKEEYIFSEIIKEEIETQSMMNWMAKLHFHTCGPMENRWSERKKIDNILLSEPTDAKESTENTEDERINKDRLVQPETQSGSVIDSEAETSLVQTKAQPGSNTDCLSGTSLDQTEAQSSSTSDCVLETSQEKILTNQNESCDDVTSSKMDCHSGNLTNQRESCDDGATPSQIDCDSENTENKSDNDNVASEEVKAESMKL
ncbi:pseudouridylate synthase 1 homolog [Ruditapes philippinarum]|uniref:pseudouridylate synthase 1 homolog n=1 Tax=Ruditapes philippinarum TaxID=129788 RepID=UPI00295AE713|nr:pseudouridylate synthase 1 homolog [Ruditapes philippinarum]